MIDAKISTLLGSGVGMVIGQITPDAVSPWATGSAAAVAVSVLAWLLTRTIPQMQRDFRETLDNISDRHERWETVRHQDSAELNATLRSLSRTCSAVHHLPEPHFRKNDTP